jgi:hypothetical protein
MNFWKNLYCIYVKIVPIDACLEAGRMKHNYRGKWKILKNLLAGYHIVIPQAG